MALPVCAAGFNARLSSASRWYSGCTDVDVIENSDSTQEMKLMSRHNQRNERNGRRQQQNWQDQNRWSGGRQDEEYGRRGQESRNWRDEDYNRPGGQREMWESGEGRYETEGSPGQRQGWDRGWDRVNEGRGWEGDRGRQFGTGQSSYWNERYGGTTGGRGWREGWNEAMRGEGQHTGKGPRNYKRQDNRIEEDINERLTQHSMIDASDIEVTVSNGEVTLRGYVDRREAKRLAEDLAEAVFGVKEVHNQIRVKQTGEGEEATTRQETETSGKQRKAS
jgi:BON domain-containing protein